MHQGPCPRARRTPFLTLSGAAAELVVAAAAHRDSAAGGPSQLLALGDGDGGAGGGRLRDAADIAAGSVGPAPGHHRVPARPQTRCSWASNISRAALRRSMTASAD